jgi:hypothetical protein
MGGRKLTEADVVGILQRYARGDELASIARAYGLAYGYYVCEIAGRKRWANVEISPELEEMRKARYQHQQGEGHHSAKLKDEQVREIVCRLEGGERAYLLAREFGVDDSVIYTLKVGKAWRHIERKKLPVGKRVRKDRV